MLVHVDFTESYKSDQQNEIQSAYLGNQSFSLFTSCCYFKGVTSEINNKRVVVVIENSDHNRTTSMRCLRKVIESMEVECGESSMSFRGVMVMGAQFQFRFIFQLLVGIMFLNK